MARNTSTKRGGKESVKINGKVDENNGKDIQKDKIDHTNVNVMDTDEVSKESTNENEVETENQQN